MKIAILSPVTWRTPPRKYGPWEQVASNIAEGLVSNGVDVTLFATADSITKAKLDAIINSPCGEDKSIDPKVAECIHISNLMEKAGEFDLIHNNFDFLPLTYSKLIKTPMLTTIHGFSSPKILEVYRKYNNLSRYVSISYSDRNSDLNYTANVYNGINTDEFDFYQQSKEYLLFFGRLHPEKGVYEAIEIAKKSKRKLIIAGIIQDQTYFESKVKPYINDEDIIFKGNIGPNERRVLMGNAYALLHPISFDEPFGLSVAEAMFCGTPVIAFNKGSMPEIIENKKTGFLVKDTDEAAHAVRNVCYINRKYCNEWATSKFSLQRMTEDYMIVYNKILNC